MNDYSTRQIPLPAPALSGRINLSDGRVIRYGKSTPGEVLVDVYENEEATTPTRMESVAYEGSTPNKKDLEAAIEELIVGESAEVVKEARRPLFSGIFPHLYHRKNRR